MHVLPRRYVPLVVILAAHALLVALFAVFTPAWQAPDEPAHYNYVAQLAGGGCCPTIARGDWDSTYLERLKSARFAPNTLSGLDGVQYEDHQPPLYYLLLAPVSLLSGDNLLALRLVNVLFGMLSVTAVWFAARQLAPERAWLAAGAAAFVAFLPQHVHVLGSVNNDALAWALTNITLLLTVRYVMPTASEPVTLSWRAPTVRAGVAVLGVWTGSGLLLALVGAALNASWQGMFVLLLAGALAGVVWFGGRGVETARARLARGRGDPLDAPVARWREEWVLGVLVGLMFLSKTTGYFLAAVVPLALLLRWLREYAVLDVLRGLVAILRNERVQQAAAWVQRTVRESPFLQDVLKKVGAQPMVGKLRDDLIRGTLRELRALARPLLRGLALVLIPMLALGLLWWGRNLLTYGAPDFLGLAAHDRVVVGQPRTDDLLRREGLVSYWGALLGTTFVSFWGQFGWMALPLAGWMLLYVQALTLAGAAGWGALAWRAFASHAASSPPQNRPAPEKLTLAEFQARGERRDALRLLAAAGVLALLAFLYYNSAFVQFQGRYLYAALLPLALLLARGLEALGEQLAALPRVAQHRTWALWGVMLPLFALAPFALYCLWRVVVPGLTP